MSSLWADLKYALRMMAKTPAYTAVLVLTLALGIGASTTIFSVVNSVVLRPLPYQQPEQLVRIYTEFYGGMGLKKFWMSVPEYFDLQEACRSCEQVEALARDTAGLSGGDRPVRVAAAYTTPGLIPMLGVAPALGRVWSADEDVPGAPRKVIVIGHGLWKRAFGGDPSVIGREVLLENRPITIIGVMPEGFDYPGEIEAWAPAALDRIKASRGGHYLEVTARLAPGVSITELRAEIDALIAAWSDGVDDHEHNFDGKNHSIVTYPLQEEVVGSIETTLWLLQGAVLFVLLIAIANVTNLLLARAEARSREIAVRHALGATRPRLVRQLVTESLALGIIGGGLGILVAVWALDATIALIPRSAPRVREIGLDGTALGFAVFLTVASSLLFGLAPILHTRKNDVHNALKDGGPRTAGSRMQLRVRRALVVAEVALAVVLVIGCGLMVKSFVRLQKVDLGFDPDRVLTFHLSLPTATYADEAAVQTTWRRIQERMSALPGVESASLITGMLPQRPLNANDLGFPDRAPDPKTPWNTDYWQPVGDGALETLGAKIVAGRGLLPSDTADAPAVVVVNQAFAKKFFPGEDPIGQRVYTAPWQEEPEPAVQTVVGVVADIKQAGVDKPAGTEIFFPIWQGPKIAGDLYRGMYVVLRTEGDPAAVAPAAQRAIAEIDPSLPMWQLRTMDDVMWEAVARPRFLAFLLGSFAVLALLLAAIGIYGVMAYTVAQRTHEIGIRVALGAQPRQVRAMVMRQAGLLTGIGVAVGLVAALVLEMTLSSALAGPLYGERLRDPLLFVVVAGIVVAAGLFASWLPARRATRVEPTVALRAE